MKRGLLVLLLCTILCAFGIGALAEAETPTLDIANNFNASDWSIGDIKWLSPLEDYPLTLDLGEEVILTSPMNDAWLTRKMFVADLDCECDVSYIYEYQTDGRMFIDVLMDGLSSDLMGFTLDTFWLQAAGCDVIDWLDRLKDRIPCVHLKDMTVSNRERRMAPVGEGNMNFKGIMKKLDELGTTKYALVEQDTCYESPFVCMKKSYDNLVKLGYK